MAQLSFATSPSDARASVAQWKEVVARYQQPNRRRATWQVVNTFGSYAAVWVLMALAWSWHPWIALALTPLAGGLLVRIFIIFHDCGHGSFFRSRRANAVLGFVAGLLTFTPYYHWRGEHALHHKTAGDLDRRGTGDVWTMTVEEYLQASRWKRISYRLARNPVVLFVFAPLFLFLVLQRLPSRGVGPRERRSVWEMNLAILAVAVAMSWAIGFVPYAILQGLSMGIAGAGGVWMFYVQHQFEDVYWERGEDWDYTAAALRGSSFYKLPRVLQWFSGNIGFHHVHHLSPRIPNYNLEACHRADPLFHEVKPVTLATSLKSLPLRLWSEQSKKLVGYRHLRELKRKRGSAGPRP